jgi:hypothetical protein
MNQMLD